MAEIGTTTAARALADHFGPHLDAGREEGRRLMADVIHEQFGISHWEARRLVDALEQASTIRWIEGPSIVQAATSLGRAGPIAGYSAGGGYWQLEPA